MGTSISPQQRVNQHRAKRRADGETKVELWIDQDSHQKLEHCAKFLKVGKAKLAKAILAGNSATLDELVEAVAAMEIGLTKARSSKDVATIKLAISTLRAVYS